MQNGSESIAQHTRVGQIISFALLQGLIVVTALLAFLAFSKPEVQPIADQPVNVEPDQREPIGGSGYVLPGIIAFFTVGAVAANFILPSIIRKTAVKRFAAADAPREVPAVDQPVGASIAVLLDADRTARIVGQAIHESVGTIAAVCMMIDETPIYLAASAIALAGMAMHFPTATGVRHWIESVVQSRDRA